MKITLLPGDARVLHSLAAAARDLVRKSNDPDVMVARSVLSRLTARLAELESRTMAPTPRRRGAPSVRFVEIPFKKEG
jgi:hypothetical protein